jgi:hypothetical protein
VIVLAALTFAWPATAQFTQDDTTGTFRFYGRWDNPTSNDPGWDAGTFVLDSMGNATSGSSTDHLGGVTTYTGGSLLLNNLGLLSGSISTSGGSDALSDYKMSLSRELLVGVDTDPDGYVNLDFIIKTGGSFSTSDLEGDFHLFTHWDLPSQNDPGWDRVGIAINSLGTVTSTSGIDSDGQTLNLTGLPLTVDADGVITSVAQTSLELKMTPDKEMAMGVNVDDDGYVLNLVLIRTGGVFSNSDLEGRWYVHTFFDDPSGNDPGWERLVVDVSDTGAITGGSGAASDGGSDTVTGGSVSIDSSGVVSGSIEFAVSEDKVITGFKMNANHEVMAGVSTDSDGYRSLSVAVVPEPSGGASLLAAIGTLAALKRRRRYASR